MPHILMLASHVAALLFTGASLPAGMGGGITAAEVSAAKAAVLLQLKLPSDAALRQAVMAAAAPAAAAALAAALKAAGAAAGATGAPPPALLQAQMQQQAVVGCLARALLQVQMSTVAAASQAAAACARSQQEEQQRRDELLPGVYAAALPPPAAASCSGSSHQVLAAKAMPSGALSAAASKPLPASRCLRFGKVPAAVCFACCQGMHQEACVEQLWVCDRCRRTFHQSCMQPSDSGSEGTPRCNECASSSHNCFACGLPAGAAGTVKCSMAHCSRHYHWDCVRANPLSHVSANGRSAKCPLHYCAACSASGDGNPMVQVTAAVG